MLAAHAAMRSVFDGSLKVALQRLTSSSPRKTLHEINVQLSPDAPNASRTPIHSANMQDEMPVSKVNSAAPEQEAAYTEREAEGQTEQSARHEETKPVVSPETGESFENLSEPTCASARSADRLASGRRVIANLNLPEDALGRVVWASQGTTDLEQMADRLLREKLQLQYPTIERGLLAFIEYFFAQKALALLIECGVPDAYVSSTEGTFSKHEQEIRDCITPDLGKFLQKLRNKIQIDENEKTTYSKNYKEQLFNIIYDTMNSNLNINKNMTAADEIDIARKFVKFLLDNAKSSKTATSYWVSGL